MRRRIAVLAAMIALAAPGWAGADQIIYTESITTDGTLNGIGFSDKLVTLTFRADPANVVSSPEGNGYTQYANSIASATVTIDGIGPGMAPVTATLSDSFRVTVQTYSTFTDFLAADLTTSSDILDTYGSAAGFSGVDLMHAFGPISGGAAYTVDAPFLTTSSGNFTFTHIGGGVSSVSGFVPAPSGLVMTGLGSLGVALIGRLRRAGIGRG